MNSGTDNNRKSGVYWLGKVFGWLLITILLLAALLLAKNLFLAVFS